MTQFISLIENAKFLTPLSPIVVTADALATTVVDTQGYEEVTFLVNVGVAGTADGSNYFDVVIKEGDLANGSDLAVVTSAVKIKAFRVTQAGVATEVTTFTSGIIHTVNGTTDGTHDNLLVVVSFVSTKRYANVTLDETGTASVIFGVNAILTHPHVAAVNR